MRSSSMFFYFVPILTLLFLVINFLFAKHVPYQEKDSPFECGYHSFLGQSRSEFSISFFVFGLLFLLFDIELVAVFPFGVSAYNDEYMGLIIFLVFFVLLTIGFIFEIGKGALSISSRQKSLDNSSYT